MFKYAFFLISFSIGAQTFKFEADNFCPFNCKNDQNGFAVQIVEKALLTINANAKLDYNEVPWSRAVKNVETGAIDGIFGGTGFSYDTAEPKGLIYHKNPIGKLNMVLAVAKGSTFKYTDLKSLDGKKIGFVQGYEQAFSGEIGKFLVDNANNKNIIDQASGDTAGILNIKKLIAKRVDIIVEDETVIAYLTAKNNLVGQVEIVRPVDKAMYFYAGISPKNKDAQKIADAIDASVVEMRKNGELNKVLAKYGLKDWN